MKKLSFILSLLLITSLILVIYSCKQSTEPIVPAGIPTIDHSCADLSLISADQIEKAKDQLHIAYGHTSHGSQITTGMEGLVNFKGDLYGFNNGGSDSTLDLRDNPFSGAHDLGNPNRTAWATATRNYLNEHSDINVIIWSWCGQVSGATEEEINLYLNLMTELERDYPTVNFVYMTGHLDGGGVDRDLNQNNERIRKYCKDNKKILYDYADIESYDPDRQTNYMLLSANDQCYYDSDGNGTRETNWAIEWQNSHTEGVDWYQCSSAHSQPLNANQKAYAAWFLWAALAQ